MSESGTPTGSDLSRAPSQDFKSQAERTLNENGFAAAEVDLRRGGSIFPLTGALSTDLRCGSLHLQQVTAGHTQLCWATDLRPGSNFDALIGYQDMYAGEQGDEGGKCLPSVTVSGEPGTASVPLILPFKHGCFCQERHTHSLHHPDI